MEIENLDDVVQYVYNQPLVGVIEKHVVSDDAKAQFALGWKSKIGSEAFR